MSEITDQELIDVIKEWFALNQDLCEPLSPAFYLNEEAEKVNE